MHGYRGIMLDLETLGTSPGAGITEVGFCLFNYSNLLTRQQINESARHYTISLEDNLRHKMRVDRETLNWWEFEQRGMPRFKEKSLQSVLAETAHVMNEMWKDGIRDIWSKPAIFDIPILGEAMDIMGIHRPQQLMEHNFWHWQCFATLRRTAQYIGAEFKDHVEFRKQPAHSAVLDAVDQAVQANIILNVQAAWRSDHHSVTALRTQLQLLLAEKESRTKARRERRQKKSGKNRRT